MLGKLLKRDMRATSRNFIPAFIAFIVIFVLNKLMMEVNISGISNSNLLELLFLLSMSLYVISIVAIYILSQVFIVMDFYKTMAGEQGYLTHTLPAKTHTILNSKLLISAFWNVVTFLLIGFSFLVMGIGHMDFEIIEVLFDGLPRLLSYPGAFTLCIHMMIIMIVGLFSGQLMFFFAIALGNLFNRNKVAGSIAAYIGIYMILQLVSVLIFSFGNFFLLIDNAATGSDISHYFNNMFLTVNIVSIIETVIFYVGTEFIFRRKLNLA